MRVARVRGSSSAVSTPPAVTSALPKPSVPAGVRFQWCRLCSSVWMAALVKACVLGGMVVSEPALGPADGQDGAQGGKGGGGIAAGSRGEHGGEDFAAGSEIHCDGLAGRPVGRRLEDGRAAEAAMGDEELFAEGWGGWRAACFGSGVFGCGGGGHFGGDTGEVAPGRAVLG